MSNGVMTNEYNIILLLLIYSLNFTDITKSDNNNNIM